MIDFNKKKILVVVAHPDDEILGLGGSMKRLITEQQCEVRAVILGEGLTSRANQRDPSQWTQELQIHKANIETARNIIGYAAVSVYDFPDNRFDTVPLLDLIKVIEKEKNSFHPDIIFTHHGGDVNIDHQKTFDAVTTATRPLHEENVCAIITFETMSGTEWIPSTEPRRFIPNLFIDIENYLEAKCEAMNAYEFEKREYPHPRSKKALKNRAEMWGIANGLKAAEAFHIVRMNLN